MSKMKRKIFALIIAGILTAGIILSVWAISNLTRKPEPQSVLATLSQDYGTINLDCDYNESSHTLAVKQNTIYINHSRQKLYEVKFHIYANAYQKNATYPAIAPQDVSRAYPNGFDEGYIRVLTPHTQMGGVDNTVLTVPLAHALAPEQSTEIELEYSVKLPNVKHRLGYTDHAVNLGNFYAIPVVYANTWRTYPYSYNGDPFYNEPYNFNVQVHVPNGYHIAASGEPIGNNRFKGYLLRDFAMVLSRDFKTLEQKVGNTTVTYHYLDDQIPEVSLYTACNALAYFSNEFINYPYSNLTVVQTDFLHGGMEYGTLVYISLDVTDQLEYQNVIVHEIAHQWWYGLVGNDQPTTPWIDEGLAEYSTAAFFDAHPQYGKTIDDIAKANQAAITMFENIMDEYNVSYSRSLQRSLLGYKSQSEYTINTYARSMLLFYSISTMVGCHNLNQALSKFAQANYFKFCDTYNLCEILENELGKDLTKYINNYLAGNQTAVV